MLGTSNYSECIYKTEDGSFSYETPFVQIAVLKYIMPQYREGDRITVFVTEDAESANWEPKEEKELRKPKTKYKIRKRRFSRKLRLGKRSYQIQLQIKSQDNSKKYVRSIEDIEEKTCKKGLKFLLEQEFPNTPYDPVRIPEGKNKQELDQIFECIYQSFSENEIIYFDFTHSLRNLPMLALAVVNYAKVLKNIEVGGLYYGAYELKKKEKDGRVPILDMSSCSTIQDWTSAAEAFVKAGSSNQIYELYQKRRELIDTDKEYNDILESLYNLTNCLETSRGGLDFVRGEDECNKKSIGCAYNSFQDHYKKLGSKGFLVSEQPLKRLFDYIYKDIDIFQQGLRMVEKGKGKEKEIELKYTALGISVVQWALKKGLVQQGYTALNETIISYICEIYGFNGNDGPKRKLINDLLRSLKDQVPNGESRNLNENRKVWVEDWKRKNRNKMSQRKFEESALIAEKILTSISTKLIDLSNNVSEERNTLNHFGLLWGAPKESLSYKVFQDDLKKRYEELEKIIKNRKSISFYKKTKDEDNEK